jgi:dihydroorotate dehydrogenase (fumarate)/dihydroorotate dehydrogenase
MGLYRRVVRPLLFRADAEWVHAGAIRAAELAGGSRFALEKLNSRYAPGSRSLEIEVAGIKLRSPLGLAAGFDKSARAVPFLGALGFGHVEVGSISIDPSQGNPRPRLFRLPQDEAIVVHYGLPNEGAERIAQRLERCARSVPLGINVVSTNRGQHTGPEPDDAVIADYVSAAARLQGYADYLVLNLSCPNTREGRDFFSDTSRLRRLLSALGEIGITKPLFLKIAPFPTITALEAFLMAAAPASFVSGFSVNVPGARPPGLKTPSARLERMPGAVCGKPSEALANQTLRELYRRMDRRRYRLIGSGGVFSGEDAYRKMRLGASLVQMMTALVYEGPGIVKRINDDLARLAERDGVRNIGDVVGVDA